MKFSIIIPAHNAAEHIQNALDSVTEQTFTDYELIVICDSCTDNTEQIAKEYGASLVYTEMISDKALCYDSEPTYKMIEIGCFEQAKYILSLVLAVDSNNPKIYWGIC